MFVHTYFIIISSSRRIKSNITFVIVYLLFCLKNLYLNRYIIYCVIKFFLTPKICWSGVKIVPTIFLFLNFEQSGFYSSPLCFCFNKSSYNPQNIDLLDGYLKKIVSNILYAGCLLNMQKTIKDLSLGLV